MTNPELIKFNNNNNNYDYEKASSKIFSLRDYKKSLNNKNTQNNENNKIENSFIIEDEYLDLDECTAIDLGPEHIYQKCYICPICSPKKNYYICKFCYNVCHEKCRNISQTEKKLDDYKGLKDFACHCGNKLKHKPEEPQKREQKLCDLIVLDQSLDVGLFYCETHRLSICCVCSVECHKKCRVVKYKNNNPKYVSQCLCKNENHTTYNEIALTFPLNEYQKLSGVAVWPIQILNILFNQKKLENLSQLFKSMLNNEEISEEKRKKFFPLLELFSNTFNRKFKTLYYEEDIINMFKYESLIGYIKNVEINKPDMILLKFRLIFILLFVHLKNDFQITKSLTSIDFICNNILERIEYKKILRKKNLFNQKIDKKYDLYKLMEESHILKDIVINDVCHLMTLGIDIINIEENSEDFDIGLKLICFMIKKMVFTKNDLINLINSLYIFFNKFFDSIISKKSNVFLLLDLFCCMAELFLMISVNYNDLVVMDYLDTYQNTLNIKKIELNNDFLHVSSDHGNKLLKMIMKSCELLKRHYDLLNKNEEIIKEKEKKLIKDKKNLKKLMLDNFNKVGVKLQENGGLFAQKIIIEFSECLGIFCLADNVYFKQIDSITKDDLIDYYYFCDKIKNNKIGNFYKRSEFNNINEKIYNLKFEIENEFKTLFALSYSHSIPIITTDMNNLILKFSSELNKIFEIGKSQNFEERFVNMNNIKGIKKLYIKNENFRDKEKQDKVDKLNYFLTKMAVKNKKLYPFLVYDSFSQIAEEFVDNLIISNLDEIITKILVFFSHRKYPNLLSYDLLNNIYSTLCLYFYSKKGIKYLLTGKNLVRINKIFNRYDFKSKAKNINLAFGKTLETNIAFINRTFDFCLDLFKGMKLYDLSIKNHKVLYRFKKNMLGHMCLFNLVSKENNLYDFLFQCKKMMKIFYFLSEDYEFEDLDQIKKQCVFILKQNPLDLLGKNSFFNTYNKLSYNVMDYNDYIDTNKINNEDNIPKNKNKILISLYFAFFKLYSINTYYVYENEENSTIMNILYNFTDLKSFKENLINNNFSLKQKTILLQYFRSVYFIDHLNEYSILSQKNQLTTKDFILLVKSRIIVNEELQDSLNLKDPLSLPENTLEELKDKYNMISKLELVIQIYLNEIRNFPRQLLNNKLELCKLFYQELLFDIKFLSNFFYCQKNIWSKFKLLFYELCLEFIPKIDIIRNVYKSFKGNNDTIFNIGEELYSVPLDKYEEAEAEEFDHLNEDKKEGFSKNFVNQRPLTEDEEWEKIKLEAYKSIKNIKSISFHIYDIDILYSYLNEFVDQILKFSHLSHLYDLENYLRFFDENAEANFTPFSLLETLDYEYFYEEDKKEKDKLIKKDVNLYKLKNLKDSFFETFIDINNTNFMDILTKIINGNAMFDFNKTFVEFFKAFIDSKEGNNFHLLNILLCILTKMLFYNSEGLQDKFEDFINEQDFFPNMNRLLNIYIVLVFSLSKNIYAYNFVSQINNLAKLIIQLLQALGEGFNTQYHNNIFKFQKDIPLIENDNEDSYENEEELSSDLDSKKNNILIPNDNYENQEYNENRLTNLNNLKNNIIYKTQSKIEIPNVEVKNTIYNSLIINLKYALSVLDVENLIEGEMPYDKLIITITNIFDFLIEYIESEGENNEIIKYSFRNLLFGKKIKKSEFDKTNFDILNEKQCLDILFVRIEPDDYNKKLYLLRKKIICFVKYKFANLLIYYLLTGGKENMIKKLIKNNCSPIDLFSELIYNFKELLNHLRLKNPKLVEQLEFAKKSKETSDYVDLLINYYAFEEDFRNQIELQVVIQLYILIKIFEEFYNHKELKSHYENIQDNFDKSTSEIDDYYIRSKFSYCVFLFLEKIILKVEIRIENSKDKVNQNVLDERKNKIAKLVVKNLKKDPFLHKINTFDKRYKNINIQQTLNEEETDSDESESDEENSKTGIKTAFFLRPYLTFTLSDRIKDKFIREVDRTNASQKYVSLVHFADYCLFEMVANRHLIGNSKFKNYLANINYFYIELLNYIIIIFNNLFIIHHFYKSHNLPIEEYDIFDKDSISKLYLDNILISSIQIAGLIAVVIVWYTLEFINHFQFSVMNLYNKNFVFKKSGENKKISQTIIDFFQDKEHVSSRTFFYEVIKSVSKWQRFYVSLFSASLFNKEINIYLLTIILNILFLALKNYLFLVIEILFIVNIIPALFDILKAIKLKYLHITLVLIFDFLIVYVFSWFGFFFFQNLYTFDDIYISSSGIEVSESFCYSSLQCFLFYLTLGIRSNGGIAEAIEKVSYRNDAGVFIGRFFNDILFFLLINLFIGNVFLGIIIDTFVELRNIQSENENDRNNICFICQLSSDDCLTRNINFEKHINEEHNIWNYVYFLSYLHLNNPNNFNRVENSVWEKLEFEDYSWFPINTSSEN